MSKESNEEKAAIYALLGRIFITELDLPALQALQALQQAEISSVFEKLQTGFQDYLNKTDWNEQQIEQLAADYCQLFILPQKSGLSLRASHWMSSDAENDLSRLEAVINELDFDSKSCLAGVDNLPSDHLGILLYFISSIYASKRSEIRKLAKSIIQLVLLPWIFQFTGNLQSHCKNPLYLASAKLLQELMDFEYNNHGTLVLDSPTA